MTIRIALTITCNECENLRSDLYNRVTHDKEPERDFSNYQSL